MDMLLERRKSYLKQEEARVAKEILETQVLFQTTQESLDREKCKEALENAYIKHGAFQYTDAVMNHCFRKIEYPPCTRQPAEEVKAAAKDWFEQANPGFAVRLRFGRVTLRSPGHSDPGADHMEMCPDALLGVSQADIGPERVRVWMQ